MPLEPAIFVRYGLLTLTRLEHALVAGPQPMGAVTLAKLYVPRKICFKHIIKTKNFSQRSRTTWAPRILTRTTSSRTTNFIES